MIQLQVNNGQNSPLRQPWQVESPMRSVCLQLTIKTINPKFHLFSFSEHSHGRRPSSVSFKVAGSGVFIGSADNAYNAGTLNRLGITHIVNMTHDIENAFPGHPQLTYFDSGTPNMRAELHDSIDEIRMRAMLPRIVAFIKEARQDGGRVLIHCRFGLSRAPTAAIAWLIGGLNMKLDKACQVTVSARHGVRPNASFFEDLLAYEKTLFGRNSMIQRDWHRVFSRSYRTAQPRAGRFSQPAIPGRHSHVNL